MTITNNDFSFVTNNLFIYSWMIVSIFSAIFLIFKLFEKITKLGEGKFYAKIKLFNFKFLGFIIFCVFLLYINLYVFLSNELSSVTNTCIYSSPLLILIINISLPLNEIVIKGFKVNINLFTEKDLRKYGLWFRDYIISIITLVLDLFIRTLVYTLIPKLILLINYLMSFNLNLNMDVSSLIFIFEIALTIIFYLYSKYLRKSNFLLCLKCIKIKDYYNKSIDDLFNQKI